MMQRASKSQLTVSDGIASLGGIPFSGLAFDVDNDSDAIRVVFRDIPFSCRPVRSIESYSNGKLGGNFTPLDVELKYTSNAFLSFDEFPDCATDYPASLEEGEALSGIIYIPGQKFGWEARMYTMGTEDVKLWWHANSVLGLAVAGGIVHEEFRWYENGNWKQCWIFNGGTFNVEFNTDGRIAFLILKNWEAALAHPDRKTSFRCIDKLSDLFRLKASVKLHLDFDDAVANHVPEFLGSGIFDDVQCIRWNGTVANKHIDDLFLHLSRRSLKKIILGSYGDFVGEYCLMLRKKIPAVEIVSAALNMKNQ